MNDLENRLRATFTELADELPPSKDPWAEQQRRLAAGSRRGRQAVLASVGTAAAAVLVLVGAFLVPGLLTERPPRDQVAGAGPEPTSGAPPAAEDTLPYRPHAGTELLAGPYPLGEVRWEGERHTVGAYYLRYTDPNGPRGTALCVRRARAGMPINEADPARQGTGSAGCGQAVDPGRTAPLFQVHRLNWVDEGTPVEWLVLAMGPQVQRVELRNDHGALIRTTRAGGTGEAALFYATVPDPGLRPEQLRYLARDATGEQIGAGPLGR
ncbi:hypothetical protein [Amycolatopsis aidingensis]|uniref:hypothetical protein n=1 Tax=Amycolatopsis aidingensis TaxID=2842453 RepID=UPI001C0CD0CA|nr:hypothetical protein [Amycolatopsis aidingensis]